MAATCAVDLHYGRPGPAGADAGLGGAAEPRRPQDPGPLRARPRKAVNDFFAPGSARCAAVALAVALVPLANAHLVYGSPRSQPDCVAHVRSGDPDRAWSYGAAKPLLTRADPAGGDDARHSRRRATACRSTIPFDRILPRQAPSTGWRAGWRDLHDRCRRRACSTACIVFAAVGRDRLRAVGVRLGLRALPGAGRLPGVRRRCSPLGSTRRAAAWSRASRSASAHDRWSRRGSGGQILFIGACSAG